MRRNPSRKFPRSSSKADARPSESCWRPRLSRWRALLRVELDAPGGKALPPQPDAKTVAAKVNIDEISRPATGAISC